MADARRRLFAGLGHSDAATACAFSPDGTRVVSASYDRTLKLWGAASGLCLATWPGHKNWVTACAFSPDGTRVVSASYDRILKLWDAASGLCLATWPGHENTVTACAFSPDGTRVVSGGADGTLRVWDAASGRRLRVHQLAGGGHAVWDANDSRLIEASDGAWRWLRWQIFDSAGHLVNVLPAEAFGELPPSAS